MVSWGWAVLTVGTPEYNGGVHRRGSLQKWKVYLDSWEYLGILEYPTDYLKRLKHEKGCFILEKHDVTRCHGSNDT